MLTQDALSIHIKHAQGVSAWQHIVQLEGSLAGCRIWRNGYGCNLSGDRIDRTLRPVVFVVNLHRISACRVNSDDSDRFLNRVAEEIEGDRGVCRKQACTTNDGSDIDPAEEGMHIYTGRCDVRLFLSQHIIRASGDSQCTKSIYCRKTLHSDTYPDGVKQSGRDAETIKDGARDSRSGKGDSGIGLSLVNIKEV